VRIFHATERVSRGRGGAGDSLHWIYPVWDETFHVQAQDLGVSDMRADERKRILDLFQRRKPRRMEITWIEERDGRLTYQGRPVKEI